MTEELFINVSHFETRVARLKDGSVEDIHLERARHHSVTGNIYLGKVVRVVPGMQAAFVDVGLDRPGFLHARDIESPGMDNNGTSVGSPDIRNLVRDGQELLVQISKDPISGKGARLTTQLAIASRYLVLMPEVGHIGISQRIEEEAERERLRDGIDGLRRELDSPMGFIARTACEGVAEADLRIDMRVLLRIWERVKENRVGAKVGQAVYEELPLHIRVVRDWTGPELKAVFIDHAETYRRVREFTDRFLPELSDRIMMYSGERPLFSRHNIDEEIQRALDPRVALKCGGYLLLEQTEAMITIDVNTGGYVGQHSLEETVYRTNLEAAQVVPRQLRLRNLGGIVVIDFIDMEEEEHQRQVLRALEKACEGDHARIRIEGFSGLGLVQLSRKRTRESLYQQICEPCGHCEGRGIVKTSESTSIEILRSIFQDARVRACEPGKSGDYLIRAPEAVIDRLLDEDADHLAQLAQKIGREVRFQVEPSYGPGGFDIVLVQSMQPV